MADILLNVAPYLGATGTALSNIDDNNTGADDFAAELLIYAGEVIAAVAADEEIPAFPEAVRAGTSDRISGIARVSLIVANSILTVVQFQVAGRAARILKYVNQAIRNLLAGIPVPAAPTI
ncbi:MAG TPA: hypothetical protein VJ302_29065 [Blastocatellia bacterium]|nr:hypothetical protein [Blastocatellia bacterium]